MNLTQIDHITCIHVQMHTNKLYLDTFPFPFSIEFNCSTVLKIFFISLDF